MECNNKNTANVWHISISVFCACHGDLGKPNLYVIFKNLNTLTLFIIYSCSRGQYMADYPGVKQIIVLVLMMFFAADHQIVHEYQLIERF